MQWSFSDNAFVNLGDNCIPNLIWGDISFDIWSEV